MEVVAPLSVGTSGSEGVRLHISVTPRSRQGVKGGRSQLARHLPPVLTSPRGCASQPCDCCLTIMGRVHVIFRSFLYSQVSIKRVPPTHRLFIFSFSFCFCFYFLANPLASLCVHLWPPILALDVCVWEEKTRSPI